MKTWNRARGITVALLVFCAAAAILLAGVGRLAWVPMALVPLALAVALDFEVRRNARGTGAGVVASDQAGAEKTRLLLQTISHQRHDFMNDIQVLYGYVRLKKYDNLLDFVENMKSKAARESSISRLGAAELALYLHSFRVRHHSVELDVELDQDINLAELPIDAERTGDMAMALMEAIVGCVRPALDEPVRLAVELYTEDDAVYLCFEFYGESEVERLEQSVAEAVRPYRETLSAQADSRIDEQWATVEVRVPFQRQAASA